MQTRDLLSDGFGLALLLFGRLANFTVNNVYFQLLQLERSVSTTLLPESQVNGEVCGFTGSLVHVLMLPAWALWNL